MIPSVNTAVLTEAPPIEGKRRPLLTPIPNSPGEFLLVIDNSSLEKFTTCPQSAEYYLVHNREPHAKNSALVFGGAIHVGIEALERGLPDEAQDRLITEFFTNHPTPIGDYRTVTVALQVMKHYRQRIKWPDYEWEGLADKDGKQIVEIGFELPLGVVEVGAHIDMPWLTDQEITDLDGPVNRDGQPLVRHIHIAWSGRIDRIAKVNGFNSICDHKTTSIGGDQVTSEYHLSNPMLGYTWASRQLYPEHDILSACMNFIHLKKPTVSGYPADLTARGPRGGDSPLNFFRAYYHYTTERLDWWKSNVLSICSDLIANLVRNYFPSHTKQCIGKYGKCPYWDVCTNDNPQVRTNMIHSDLFQEVTWNPVANR